MVQSVQFVLHNLHLCWAGQGSGHRTTGSVNKLVKSVEHTIAINRLNCQRVTHQDGVCGLVWNHAEVPGVCGSAPGCCPGLLPSGVCQVILELATNLHEDFTITVKAPG